MRINPDLDKLQQYPFEKLRMLTQNVQPASHLQAISLSIGEPKHPTPELIKTALSEALDSLAQYPLIRGTDTLRDSITRWLETRFNFSASSINAQTQVLPVNGTREALFAIAQSLIDSRETPQAEVFLPNPFYQIYEGACLLAGAKPRYLNCLPENNFIPDFDLPASAWEKCRLLFLCSPGNPTGAVIPLETLQQLIELALQYDFTLVSDECYSEIYRDEANPPTGLLQACMAADNPEFRNCLVFHSLSKRSNAPGLRSGFVAGDSRIIEAFRLYRTYHGCAMPPPIQQASAAAWNDEAHVIENRRLYREKFEMAIDLLQPVIQTDYPEGGFYLWLKTPVDDTQFCKLLYKKQNITVLPGSYLSRHADQLNPGKNRIRLALVEPFEQCQLATQRLREFIIEEQFLL